MIPIVSVGPANGGPGELDKCEFLQRELERLQFEEIERVDSRDERANGGVRPNLVAKLRKRDTPTLWIVAHIDTVPEGDISLWHHPPFAASFEDGKVYGRGTEDDGQGIVLGLLTAKKLIDQERTNLEGYGFGLVFLSDEENGSVHGAQHFFRARSFSKRDVFLVADAGSPDGSMIEVAEKTVLWLKLIVTGKQTHGSLPERGKNANRAGMKIALAIDELLHRKYDAADPLFVPPSSTFEPTKREPNVPNINTVPGSDVCYFDCRILPKYDPAAILADLNELLRIQSKMLGVEARIETVSGQQPAPVTSPDSPVIRKLSSLLTARRKIEPKPMGIGGGTDARTLRAMGYESVVWMTCDETAHSPDEYARLSNIISDSEIVMNLLE